MMDAVENPPRRPAAIAKDLRSKKKHLASKKQREKFGPYNLAVEKQRLEDELRVSKNFWIRRV